MKKIGRSVGRRNPHAIARQVLAHQQVKDAVLKVTGKQIQKEMMIMCKQGEPSILRDSSKKALQSFQWDTLMGELKAKAPTLLKLLQGCIRTKRRRASAKGRSYAADEKAVIGLCAAILLRHRNANMNLVQRIVSVLLYSGHAPKQVIRYTITEVFVYEHK